jgi:NAD(P)-dependent dehydrogenase (short-subunit alcohol dehydrogenase family)
MTRNRSDGWTVVTGASGGLGRALIAQLVTDGRNVIATARQAARIAMPRGPGRVERVNLDMEQSATMAHAFQAISRIAAGSGLSGLVNMAGVIVEGPLEAITPTQLRRQLDINVVGPFALSQGLLPLLKRGRGTIVNIGAISAHLTVPFYGPIAASKSALASLNDAMRLEFAQFGMRVILVEPGAMKTGIFSTSRAARDANLSASPELERRYRPALAAMDRAFDKAGADDPRVVVEAVMKALNGNQSKLRVVVGKGTGTLLLLARLPIGTRDKLVKNALGVAAALKSAI